MYDCEIYYYTPIFNILYGSCKLSKLAKKGFTLTGRKTRVWKLISKYFISSSVLMVLVWFMLNRLFVLRKVLCVETHRIA